MGDIQTRPFSKNYSGLINQSVIGIAITVICVGGQELMKRARRGRKIYREGVLGSRESWEFGYLYQGRSWARYASPPIPLKWPLGWIPQVLKFSEEQLNQLRGVDAALYIRFLRGCFWFTLLHTCTTFPILFPIHVEFSEGSISPKSMTRASISSLVGTAKGLSLLWIHICLLFWITLSWIATLFWVMHGAFRMRSNNIMAALKRKSSKDRECHKNHPHPHPPYNFTDVPSLDTTEPVEGFRLRTVMVSNVPPQLRNENELKEYFEYYMSRKLERPALGLNSTTQPGMFNKMFAFLFNRVKKIPVHLPAQEDKGPSSDGPVNSDDKPVIERVVIARKMTELASLLERREEMLRLLETAHIKLAQSTLDAVKSAMDSQAAHKPFSRSNSRAGLIAKQRQGADPEVGDISQDGTMTEEQRVERLIKVLGPYVDEFGLRSTSNFARRALSKPSKYSFKKLRTEGSVDSDSESTEAPTSPKYPPSAITERPRRHQKTVWDALLGLPRNALDAYQPLVRLSHLFRGKTVPSIDYYTAKLNLLTSLITENRAKPVNRYDPVSTAFVTFAAPEDARRACKYLAVHPNNPLACLVTMAPQYQDLDWHRVMKTSFNAEFVKDWVVGVGVWAFTIFWLFPVSLLVGLVSIQNISTFWPKLKSYLDKHPWEEEVIQSFVPTLLVALLALLIPLILLLIGKKAHTITTLSALHDRIMTRYYKFLIVNVLVFFCVGTAALQSVLNSVGGTSASTVLNVVATSFPTAGPFYVGWLIFTTAMHGGFEIALLGLPLIMYPTTKRQVTPRRRAVGIRPRTFNYYYWLPTHLLVIHVLMVFSILNPVVIPFGLFYFFIESGVVKNQLIHVYAKNYEGDGKLILIRATRYSLDGLILSQFVFMAYMVVLKKSVNVGLSAFLIVFTAFVKIFMTRICRSQFENDDIREAQVICGTDTSNESAAEPSGDLERDTAGNLDVHHGETQDEALVQDSPPVQSKVSLRIPAWVSSSYATIRQHPRNIDRRLPIPFTEEKPSLSRLKSMHSTAVGSPEEAEAIPIVSLTTVAQDNFGPVTPHPPPVAWDDQSNPDLPYDNPYYTRAISNVLWLPRNPCGILDLDDTIDLKVAISVDPAAGQLGTWLGVSGETRSPADVYEIALDSSRLSPPPFLANRAPSMLSGTSGDPNEVLSLTSEPEEIVDGTEEIDLPEILARRAQQKDDVEQAARLRRPSTFRHKSSSPSLGSHQRRSSFRQPPIGSASDLHRAKPRKQTSLMSAFGDRPREGDPAARPDAHAQAELVMAHPAPSRISIEPAPTLKRSTNISANRAIQHEVLAEEKHALEQRLEEEQAQVDKGQSTKSWLTRWMFAKPE
ncbi:hypothetical protein GYMLUDRAFT_88867 [Collybiopsis luxurians FD-317 M1]|uniref:DUF221-domain-containing protein n=1 Tax=Collybiopsis luxurians FD-317 M1 TaxID=944289 RepID=A0A0D0BR35_9AGAR|nr:hypothetical protein GYMLUDRAFT_88867 [Collybiopsis luxurians FD-317 M1]